MTPYWQTRRSSFNHDWLKNKYLNRLTGFLERLKTPDPDIVRLARFIEEDFPEWEMRRDEILNLVASFEEEMSPRSLFEQGQLNQCDENTKRWLLELVHTLWMVRYPVKEWVITTREAIQIANDKYDHIAKKLKGQKVGLPGNLKSLLTFFLEFKGACERLSKTISYFPHEVLTT